jgi:hypothetical protein
MILDTVTVTVTVIVAVSVKLYSMYCGSLLLVLLALRAVTGTGYLVS